LKERRKEIGAQLNFFGKSKRKVEDSGGGGRRKRNLWIRPQRAGTAESWQKCGS